MLEFTHLRKNVKKDFTGFTAIRVALLSDSSSQLLHQALKGHGYDKKLNYDIYEADYNQVEQEVINPLSGLYAFAPEVVVIAKSTQELLSQFYSVPADKRIAFAQETFQRIQQLISTIKESLSAKIIVFNFQETDDKVFGNYANKLSHSFLYQVRKLNLLLMEEAQVQNALFICDVQQLTMQVGLGTAVDSKNLVTANQTWSLHFLPVIAKNISAIIEAIYGCFKKCLILDLDNTVWGGVIGDDGLEGIQVGTLGIGKAFTQLQKWVKELRRRGIIICVCSKNTESIAKEVFEKHPEMVLRLDDIAVFAVNWDNKVDNIHFIKATLNIGFDSMVFIDDSPFERAMVKEAIPALEVPHLPEDPVDYLPYLQSLNLFETASYAAEDEQRTQLYKQEAERTSHQQVYQNEEEFLASLEMEAEISLLNAFTIPRAAQLSQRSNQFNLRTVRYTEQDLEQIAASPDYHAFTVKLKDKFGDNGIISLVVLKRIAASTLFIESWLMSCRVLKRGVENLALNAIASIAATNNCTLIMGEYMPTPKNTLVQDHYKKLLFEQQDALWTLAVPSYIEKKVFIKIKQLQAEPV
ncbi:MAG TPA: HAD-IIIC family phosphatase [Flavisolibacter sp.]|nr:HAD-IIIC family phosphatase [Flavisolibacter sp.]